jgi:hypothetical protein
MASDFFENPWLERTSKDKSKSVLAFSNLFSRSVFMGCPSFDHFWAIFSQFLGQNRLTAKDTRFFSFRFGIYAKNYVYTVIFNDTGCFWQISLKKVPKVNFNRFFCATAGGKNPDNDRADFAFFGFPVKN